MWAALDHTMLGLICGLVCHKQAAWADLGGKSPQTTQWGRSCACAWLHACMLPLLG
jgi:hypothetical protein